MDRATRGRSNRRWLATALLATLLVAQAGCYCADWRWIWEDDDDDCHNYYPPPMVVLPAGAPGY